MENKEMIPFEKKVVHTSLLVIMLVAGAAAIHHIVYGSKFFVLVITLVGLIYYIGLYAFLTIKGIYKPLVLPIIISVYVILVLLWILIGGSYSSIPYAFQLAMLGVVVIAYPRYRLWVVLLFVSTAIFLSYINSIFDMEIVPAPNAIATKAIPMIFNITLVGIAVIAYFLKYNFDLEHQAIQEKNEILSEKNRIISEQNEEITQMNQMLDQNVQERTRQLEEQNEQLIQYAYYNAHKVRGPLCRILGLVYLAKRQQMQDIEFIMQKIEESAQELDIITKAINDNLQDKE